METKADFGSADLGGLQRVMGSIDLESCCDERLRELLACCGAGRRRIDGVETRVIREVKRRQAGPPRDGGSGGNSGGARGGDDGGGSGGGPDGGDGGRGRDGDGGAGTDGAEADSSGVDDRVRQGGGTSRREARRKIERAELADRFPILGRDLEDGLTNTENADSLAAAVKRLTDSECQRLAALDGELAAAALHHLATRIVPTPASTRTAGDGSDRRAHHPAGDDGAGGTARGSGHGADVGRGSGTTASTTGVGGSPCTPTARSPCADPTAPSNDGSHPRCPSPDGRTDQLPNSRVRRRSPARRPTAGARGRSTASTVRPDGQPPTSRPRTAARSEPTAGVGVGVARCRAARSRAARSRGLGDGDAPPR